MNIIQAIILGIVQGATEFIPVSSSAHLTLVPWALGWPAPSLLFDTLLHWGTLVAVLGYFWREWLAVIGGFIYSLGVRGPWNAAPGGRLERPESRLAWALILGTIPAVILGVAFKDVVEALFATPAAVAAFLLLTGVILVISERVGSRVRPLERIGAPDALLVGVAQAIAIAPGISRSGATIAAGLTRGFTREAAARYSFMLSMPAILGAGVLQLPDALAPGGAGVSWLTVGAGALAASIAGYLCIRFLLGYLRRRSLYVFAAYCAVAGVAALVLATVR